MYFLKGVGFVGAAQSCSSMQEIGGPVGPSTLMASLDLSTEGLHLNLSRQLGATTTPDLLRK